MNKSAIIIGVITLVLFGACQDYESVAYTQRLKLKSMMALFWNTFPMKQAICLIRNMIQCLSLSMLFRFKGTVGKRR